MMRNIVALVFVVCSSIDSALAAVDAPVCGNWQSTDGAILRIQNDGQFSKSKDGHTETGVITAIDGKFSLQSNNGKPDSGTFSVLKDSLTLRSTYTSTTTWKRTSGAVSSAPLVSTIAPKTPIASPTLQSSISQSVRQSIAQTQTHDQFAQTQNYSTPPQPPVVNKPPRRGFKDSFKSLVDTVASSNTLSNTGSFNNRPNYGNQPGPGFTGSPAGGGGTYSEMRKAFEQQQLNSLPPARPISNNPQGDETDLYGVNSFERRALGPATPVRIKLF
ncbi:MAG: hypothetical protein SGJ27_12795 [Candidatus Melainabacteria bacterium]|nr:hypothetical protein [Candidatus Melainabacteria bacterium]